jgi:hypothetical protein
VPGINVPTEPSVTKQEAPRVTLEHIAAIGGTAAIVKEIRTPVVFVDGDDKAYLAYPVLTVYTYKGNPHSDDVFIDAIAGVVVGSHPLVMTGRDREIYDGSAGGYACGSAPVHPYVPLPGAPLLAAFARGGRRVNLTELRGGPPAHVTLKP